MQIDCGGEEHEMNAQERQQLQFTLHVWKKAPIFDFSPIPGDMEKRLLVGLSRAAVDADEDVCPVIAMAEDVAKPLSVSMISICAFFYFLIRVMGVGG